MSLLRNILNPLFYPATASDDASYRRSATGHIGLSGLFCCGSDHSPSATTTPTSSSTSRISSMAHAYPSYGLEFFITTFIGLYARLGSLSRPTILPFNISTSTTSEPPASTASSSLPATPEPHETHRGACGRIRFARTKPPGVEWGVQTSVYHERDSLIASGSVSSAGTDGLSNTLVDSRCSTRTASEDVVVWLKDVCQEGLPEGIVSSTQPDAASQASPYPPPRRFADASVQTDDVSVNPSLPSVPAVPSAPNSCIATEPYLSVRATSNSLVPTAPNSLVPTEIDGPSAARDDEEASVPLTESDDANPAQKPADIPLASLCLNHYNHHQGSYPDVVEHNGVDYQILGVLGEGSFGRVFFAFTSVGKSVALKTFHKAKCYRWPGVKEELVNERKCLALAAEKRLPFWTGLNAAWEDSCNVYMEMDMCTGTLRDLVKNSGASLTVKEMKLICAEMLLSLCDLKRYQVVHGDIKPDNFLVRPDGRVVLSDFGFATSPTFSLSQEDSELDPAQFSYWKTTRGGTPGYMAPAVIAEDGRCSHQTDIFSLGVVFLELMAGLTDPLWDIAVVPEAYPGTEDAWNAMSTEKRQGWLLDIVGLSEVEEVLLLLHGQQGLDLCKKMIFEEPTVEELKKHPYFYDVDFDEVYNGLVPHDYKPYFGDIRTSPEKCDLTFAAWHRHEEAPAEYGDDAEFAQVVNDCGEVVYPSWILDNEAAREQMAESLANFEWPEPTKSPPGAVASAAPSMLFRRPAPPRVSPSPAPLGPRGAPGHRSQGAPMNPPGLQAQEPVAPPSPRLAPVHLPDSPLPPVRTLPPPLHPADYFPPPGLPPLGLPDITTL